MQAIPFYPADVLLPRGGFETWAVIACDQFTSQPAYWRQAEALVGQADSTLRLTLPEIYLEQGDRLARINDVNRTMQEYCDRGVLTEYPNAMVLVERTTPSGVRRGIVGAVDLAAYDYRKGSRALIRATEETVLSRIPPRVQIRRDAPLELPHVLLLMDDPADSVLQAACAGREDRPLYDCDLMLGGGHVTGRLLTPAGRQAVQAALQNLLAGQADPLLFVVGDGNHSLATAKECAALTDDPAAKRALVEVVNLHDPAIQFEPIYRVLFGVDPAAALAEIGAALGRSDDPAAHRFTCVYAGGETTLTVPAAAKLPVATLQPVLDAYLARHPDVKIDYIHGQNALRELAARPDALGFLFAGMRKQDLFDAVRQDGSLPRKTFSMGHAEEKRYYMEARRIRSAKD